MPNMFDIPDISLAEPFEVLHPGFVDSSPVAVKGGGMVVISDSGEAEFNSVNPNVPLRDGSVIYFDSNGNPVE